MRRLSPLLLSLALVTAPALPQSGKPPALTPLDDSEAQITLYQRDGETIEEYRANGRLYKVRIIPASGEPYILVDHRGEGNFLPHDGPGTPGLSVPQWVIGTF